MEWHRTSKKPPVSYKYRISAFIISAWWLLCLHSIAIAASWNEPIADHTWTSNRPTGLILSKPNINCPLICSMFIKHPDASFSSLALLSICNRISDPQSITLPLPHNVLTKNHYTLDITITTTLRPYLHIKLN